MPLVEMKAVARKTISDNAPKLFFVSILYIIIVTVMSELEFRLPGTMAAYEQYYQRLTAGELPGLNTVYSNFRPSGAALAVVLWFMSSVLDAGFIIYSLKMVRGQDGGYKDIFDGFLYFGKIILIKLITTVLTILWSLLFFFPGIIAHYRYRQACYILLDDPQKSALQCIQESKRHMRGNKLDLFLLDLSFFGWFALDFLVTLLIPSPFALPIVSIWLTPYLGLTRAAYYNRLMNRLTV